MGIILSGIRLIKPAYDFCLQMTKKVCTRSLQREMEKLVNHCFYTLKPLASQLTTVERIPTSYGAREILIGEWMREKSSHQKLGSLISEDETYNFIRKYGEQMKPLVRKTIRTEFAQLTDLTKQLISYEDLTVKMDIPETEVTEHYNSMEGVNIHSMIINKIGIKTSDPWHIILFQKNGKEEERDLKEEEKAPLFEDIISYMADLFKKADAKVGQARNHNENIMKKMVDVIAPLKIAKGLKG
jgi:hypothetical protein